MRRAKTGETGFANRKLQCSSRVLHGKKLRSCVRMSCGTTLPVFGRCGTPPGNSTSPTPLDMPQAATPFAGRKRLPIRCWCQTQGTHGNGSESQQRRSSGGKGGTTRFTSASVTSTTHRSAWLDRKMESPIGSAMREIPSFVQRREDGMPMLVTNRLRCIPITPGGFGTTAVRNIWSKLAWSYAMEKISVSWRNNETTPILLALAGRSGPPAYFAARSRSDPRGGTGFFAGRPSGILPSLL